MRLVLSYLIVLVVALTGCATGPSHPVDVGTVLLDAAKKDEPGFPNGHEMLLTHFSYVGQLATSGNQTIYVVDQRAVIAGMSAPRGENAIVFFDHQRRYLGKIGYVQSRPLWCDGGRLYLYGGLDGFPQPGQNFPRDANVIDVAGGYENLKLYHAHAYGSSGGVEN